MEGEWDVIFFPFSLVVLLGRDEEEERGGGSGRLDRLN